MFDKIKKAFSNTIKKVSSKELTEKDIDEIFFDLELALLESDVAQEVIEDLEKRMKEELVGRRLENDEKREEVIRSWLRNYLLSLFEKAGSIDLINTIKQSEKPFVIVFLGINGTGKTTTIAKVANMIKKEGLSVVMAAGDTHRAGAIEQLTIHGERLGIRVIAQRYGADPAAVGKDAVLYAKSHRLDVVLVDTAGRIQTNKNLMDEMSKIIRVVKPNLKIFVGDSLAGNDTINQAREFYNYTNFDAAILTKADADVKGGAALSIVYITNKPILYIGVGQEYDDLIPFDPVKFVDSLVSGNG
ncbi:MAG: signal recognition particle-docking protein FtsY [Candidatus Nitrosocaldaceae archaeon]|nr:MAG: signal recognition particle-docking protein FtsY [Candidatus Nitrosocaldaceae archaeon]